MRRPRGRADATLRACARVRVRAGCAGGCRGVLFHRVAETAIRGVMSSMRLRLVVVLAGLACAFGGACSNANDASAGAAGVGTAIAGATGTAASGTPGGSASTGTAATMGTAAAGVPTGAVGGAPMPGAGTGVAGTPASTGGVGGNVTGPVVRFVAMGDTGEGNDTQKTVAAAITTVCAMKGCDFVQLLGDNFYENGVDGNADPQWQSKFEVPYQGVDLPFWVVLGNHDNGGNGAGTEPARGDFQVQYAMTSTKWKMPARFYSHGEGPAEFFGLDTNAGMLGQHAMQTTEVAAMMDKSTAAWKVAFGHHPYLSNGPHGNAGSYEGLAFLPGVNGAGVKELLDGSVCGKADVYICGHDHSKQWLEGTCADTVLIVSGGGAKTTDLPGQNANLYQDNVPGFLWAEISGNTFLGEFYDQNGAMQFSRSITK